MNDFLQSAIQKIYFDNRLVYQHLLSHIYFARITILNQCPQTYVPKMYAGIIDWWIITYKMWQDKLREKWDGGLNEKIRKKVVGRKKEMEKAAEREQQERQIS